MTHTSQLITHYSLLLFQSLLGHLNGLHHGPGLVAGLLVLALRIRVGHDPRPGLDVSLPTIDHDRADIDAGVHVAGKAEVPHRAGVRPAPRRLEFFDDFHRANLGRA